jgi:hypothetical protein
MNKLTRRRFIQNSAAATFACAVRPAFAEAPAILGQGDFRYRVVPGWGELGDQTPVGNCHGIVTDRQGHIILLTDQTRNNVIIYDKAGKLVHKWGTMFPGAHGLSIVSQGEREVLFITDLKTHKVYKTSLDGEVLGQWGWPKQTGKYGKEDDYRPSWTLHLPDGGFFVLDGYGRDYITRFDAGGAFVKIFGGAEGGIHHWGPHGGMIDLSDPAGPSLLIAMSDQQYLLRLSPDGEKLKQIDMPGGDPRQIRLHNEHYFVAHLGDNWPKDKNCHGFVSVLDRDFRIVSNVGGTPPVYNQAGQLRPMRHQEDVFLHPHDLVVDDEQSLYVAQFASNNTYPIKLERV